MNIILIGLVSAVTGILLWYQDYAGTMTTLAWISVICMTIWDAIYSYKRVSFVNLITLAAIAMLVGFLTELIGTQEGLWNFGAHNQSPALYYSELDSLSPHNAHVDRTWVRGKVCTPSSSK